MNRILIIIFFSFNITYGQSTIQHEPRKAFVITLDVPDNIRNSNIVFKEIATEKKIKRLTCYRDNKISSDLYFDTNGNVILKTENENKVINKTEYEYDQENRCIKKSHYSPDGSFNYGKAYQYTENTTLTYSFDEKTLETKETILKDERINIYTKFDLNKSIQSQTIRIYDENTKLHQKIEYYDERIQREFVYYQKDGERYEDEVLYLDNGEKEVKTKIDKENFIYDNNGNLTKIYNDDFLVSHKKYNSQNRKVLSEFYSFKKGHWKTVTYIYENDTLLINKNQRFILDDEQINYAFVYNKEFELVRIIKSNGIYDEVFKYSYEYYY